MSRRISVLAVALGLLLAIYIGLRFLPRAASELPFYGGEMVVTLPSGGVIRLSDGRVAEGYCYVIAPARGTVSRGAVNPWPAEVAGVPECVFRSSTPTIIAPDMPRA